MLEILMTENGQSGRIVAEGPSAFHHARRNPKGDVFCEIMATHIH